MSPKDFTPDKGFSEPPKLDLAKEQEQRPFTIMTEKDAMISERMKSQPKTLKEIETEVVMVEDKEGIHRLSLPEFFEVFSYDCTRGIGCPHHAWKKEEIHYGLELKMARWNQGKRGKYIFRWLNSNPRALDHNINVRGWYLVNKTFFPEAPKILFGVNGGVANGDSILAFMSVSKALSLREKPSKDSLNHVDSVENKHENHPNFYKAKLDSEKTDGDDFAPADARQEGRDF